MCLQYSKVITDEVMERFDSNGELIAYKIYINNGNHLASPYMGDRVSGPGVIYAKDKTKDLVPTVLSQKELETLDIHVGIHVYINFCDARDSINNRSRHFNKIVPVLCKREDLRGAGNYNFRMNAVFTKIEIKENDYYIAVERKDQTPLWVAGDKGTLNSNSYEAYTNFRGGIADIIEVTTHNVKFRYGGLSWTCGKNYFANNYSFSKSKALSV